MTTPLFQKSIIRYSSLQSASLLTEKLLPLETEDGQPLQKEKFDD